MLFDNNHDIKIEVKKSNIIWWASELEGLESWKEKKKRIN